MKWSSLGLLFVALLVPLLNAYAQAAEPNRTNAVQPVATSTNSVVATNGPAATVSTTNDLPVDVPNAFPQRDVHLHPTSPLEVRVLPEEGQQPTQNPPPLPDTPTR